MTPANHVVVGNQKYVWDGAEYAQEADAARAAETYRASGFDVRVVPEGGAWFVYTRRNAAATEATRS